MKVRVEIDGKRRPGPSLRQVLDELAHGIAVAMRDAISERVRSRGDLAGQRPPAPSQSPVSVPVVYADGVGGELTDSGLERHESRAEWQGRAGVVRGSYDVSGGMWGGLREMRRRARESWLQFEGQSLGQVADVVDGVAVPRMVSNAEKAATVLEANGVNVLALADREVQAIARGVALSLARGLSTTLPLTWSTPLPPVAARGVAEIFRQVLRET